MKQLKEHWPILAIIVFLAWVMYPGFAPVKQNVMEHPGLGLHRKTAENRAFQSVASDMLKRSKQT
jgi:hypothetical protein